MALILATILIQLPLMILLPLALGWWIRRRYGMSWGLFGAGALTFIASQVVHLPLNYALGLLGGGRGVALWPLPAIALVAGLSAGVCEEGARWIALRFFLKRSRGWRPALQFGAGHGGSEAIIFGVLVMINFITMLALRGQMQALPGVTPEMAEQIRAAEAAYWATPWYLPIVAGLERLFAITIQIAFAQIVMAAFTRHQPAYLALAIGAHAAVDAWAVWSMDTWGILATEASVALFAAAAFWLIWRLRQAPEPDVAAAPVAAQPPALTAADLTPAALSAEELARRAEASRYE